MHNTSFVTFVCAVALFGGFTVVAAADTRVPAEIETCNACHTQGAVAAAPGLAAQKPDYLRKQLHEFRSGTRRDPLMSPVARTLSDEQIDSLAQYYASLSPPSHNATLAPALDPSTRPLVFCVRCHGAQGTSPNDLWPSLAGMNRDYMRKQVAAFASGERRDDMMANWGRMVDPQALDQILEFFSAQTAKPGNQTQ